ncbi:MAG: PHP domain-containing protein, partial [bacterium]
MLKNDLHVHSIGSGHAYSTISEIFRFASKNTMDLVAIADHGPDMEGAPHLGYFENMLRLPKTIDGVTFLKSCEANILNENGDIDIPLDLQNKLDFVMAGLHARTDYAGRDTKENTQAVIN